MTSIHQVLDALENLGATYTVQLDGREFYSKNALVKTRAVRGSIFGLGQMRAKLESLPVGHCIDIPIPPGCSKTRASSTASSAALNLWGKGAANCTTSTPGVVRITRLK